MGSTDYRLDSLEEPVDVAEYLFTRLHQVGIRSVHGLPGDYNLASLDYVSECGLTWVGNPTAYAADGYARVKGISPLMTTFGVGELSALNGIAGAFAEQVPLVHIVGCPSTTSEQNGLLLHHTLGNGDFNVFKNMSSLISCYVTKLNQPNQIALEIDTAIRECWVRSRPAYIMLPSDMVKEKIEGARLKTRIDLSDPLNDHEKEAYVVDVILKYLYAARNPIVLVDACAIRHRVVSEVHRLLDKTNLPVFVAPMGKGAINEQHPTYGGIYAGNASHPSVAEAVEAADLVLSIGSLKSDLNTAGFSYRLSQLNTIDLHSTHCTVRYSEYPGTGTASFGIWETKFPNGVTALNQTLWGSIGWSVGACQGAALAAKDAGVDRRTVLTIVRHGLRVTLFCICNEGYTIERFIHGAEAEYNDIVPWRFKDTPAAFGASAGEVSTHVVRTKAELDGLLRDRDFNEARNLQFVELHVPKMDAPRPLVMVANAAAKNNSKA
ncbi:DHS-like NAD/FAD-binding domain-containing protein [Diaporthe sp. PMI_573]|nr:DHS-like NAD/FAD-binding domain-containing protein [Diaporthaceae sp. PMI_573]